MFLEEGADAQTTNAQRWTILADATYRGHAAVKVLLAQDGVDPNFRDAWGNTPLLIVSSWGTFNLEVMKLLLAKEAVVELLLTRGVDMNSCDNAGDTPLDFALYNHNGATKLLRQWGGKSVGYP